MASEVRLRSIKAGVNVRINDTVTDETLISSTLAESSLNALNFTRFHGWLNRFVTTTYNTVFSGASVNSVESQLNPTDSTTNANSQFCAMNYAAGGNVIAASRTQIIGIRNMQSLPFVSIQRIGFSTIASAASGQAWFGIKQDTGSLEHPTNSTDGIAVGYALGDITGTWWIMRRSATGTIVYENTGHTRNANEILELQLRKNSDGTEWNLILYRWYMSAGVLTKGKVIERTYTTTLPVVTTGVNYELWAGQVLPVNHDLIVHGLWWSWGE